MKRLLRRSSSLASAAVLMLSVGSASAATEPVRLEFAGYVGNPGNVRIDAIGEYGVGPVYDESTGLLYASAGTGRINAYRLDGALEASYRLPGAEPFRRFDTMVHAGNGRLLILAGGSRGARSQGSVYRIRIGAPDGAEADKVPGVSNVNGMTMSAREGKVILHRANSPFIELDSATFAMREIGPSPSGTIGDGSYFCMLDWGPDGNVYWLYRHFELHQFAFQDGIFSEVVNDEFPREEKAVLQRGRIIDDVLWILSGGDTIKRWDARTFTPAPGVVHGGTSGSFLGKVDRNAEMQLDGICRIREGLYAVTAHNNGAVYILKWNPETQHLDEVRRIGVLPEPQVLLLDSRGLIYSENLVWRFDDEATAPPRFTCNVWRNFVGVVAEDDTAVVAAFDGDKLSFRNGTLDQELETWGRQIPGMEFKSEAPHAGSFVRRKATDNTMSVIRIGQDGKGFAFTVDSKGSIDKNRAASPVRLILSSGEPPNQLPPLVSSVSGLSGDSVLAVVDGRLIVFAPDATGNYSIASSLKVAGGENAAVAVDGDRLCVVDPATGTLRLIDLSSGIVLASADGLDMPMRVAFRNGRICVYEAGAQRLSKFLVRESLPVPRI